MSHELQPDAPILRWFDEECYLKANPDVAAAVVNGAIPSGSEHYKRYGYTEGRDLGLPTRRERLLFGVEHANQRGIEIGALMTPVLSKLEADISFVDHADTFSIQSKYSGDTNVDVDRIVPVDYVWSHGALRDSLPKDFTADFVLASHVIEHVPDVIRWLNHIAEILTPNIGVLRLAIPDRRFTFDILRSETRLHSILDAYLHAATVPMSHLVLDHCLHFRKVDAEAVWIGSLNRAQLEPLFLPSDYLPIASRSLSGEYLDVHCWVFTPQSFALLMGQASELGYIQLSCSDFHFGQPFENEFIVGLRPCSDRVEAANSWRHMNAVAEKKNSLIMEL